MAFFFFNFQLKNFYLKFRLGVRYEIFSKWLVDPVLLTKLWLLFCHILDLKFSVCVYKGLLTKLILGFCVCFLNFIRSIFYFFLISFTSLGNSSCLKVFFSFLSFKVKSLLFHFLSCCQDNKLHMKSSGLLWQLFSLAFEILIFLYFCTRIRRLALETKIEKLSDSLGKPRFFQSKIISGFLEDSMF